MKKFLEKPYIIFAIIGLGIIIAIIFVKTKAPMEHVGSEMPSKNVAVINVRTLPFRAMITAYGNVEPAITLNTIAEVSGKISYLHPDLKQGSSIAGGTVVARIDPTDYKVLLKQTEADLVANKSSLKQLQVEKRSTVRSLDLAKKNLVVGEKELERIRSVFERKLVARATLDSEEQKVIQLQQQVSELQGNLDSFASRKASVEAQIERAQEQVKNQETTLGRTEITLPFSARIGNVSIEQNQFVIVGFSMFEALDINAIEINSQLPILHMKSLMSHLQGEQFSMQEKGSMESVLTRLQLTAKVRLVGDMPDAVWEAKVLRMSESIDPTRRTLGIVVGVDRPYEKVIPGQRPPLLKGMFTAVDFFAPSQQAIVIPRKAIHNGRVYLVDKDNKLQIKSVKILHAQGDLVIVSEGIQPGEIIIINDLVPVIEGMPLSPIVDEEYEIKLAKRASGAE